MNAKCILGFLTDILVPKQTEPSEHFIYLKLHSFFSLSDITFEIMLEETFCGREPVLSLRTHCP